MRVALCIACAGCFAKPPQPGARGDGGVGDGSGDGKPPDACANGTTWSGPISIVLPGIDTATDATTSPWLSNNRDELWFTLLPNGGSTGKYIERARLVGGTWTIDQPLGTSYEDDNPFIADDGTLWFDSNNRGANRNIYSAPPGPSGTFGTPMFVVGNYKEPAVVAGSLIIYATPSASGYGIERGGRSTSSGTFAFSPVNDGTGLPVESASISQDGTTLYFSVYPAAGERIYGGALDTPGLVVTGAAPVGSFQSANAFFDPNISTDGNTLVFASNYVDGGHARIFYLTRSCL